MRFGLKTLFVITTLAAAMLVIPPMLFNYMKGFDHSMQRKFDEIAIGSSESALHSQFGEPWSSELYFSRAISYRESDFTAEELNICTKFVTWVNGANWFYCFGIDRDGKVILKADGNS